MRYSSRTLKHAIQYVRKDADLGGTELYAPLQAILTKTPAVGRVRNLILLTDGQISNEPAVIDLARKARGHNRIFSFGIGTACSAHLVKGLARATGGAAEFITGNERIEDKVLRTFGRIGSPQVSDVRIDWGDRRSPNPRRTAAGLRRRDPHCLRPLLGHITAFSSIAMQHPARPAHAGRCPSRRRRPTTASSPPCGPAERSKASKKSTASAAPASATAAKTAPSGR